MCVACLFNNNFSMTGIWGSSKCAYKPWLMKNTSSFGLLMKNCPEYIEV